MLLCLLRGSGGGQYREELIMKVKCLLGGFGGGQFSDELILNVTVFVVRVWWSAI
jgi:hypothetical protein